MRRHGKRQAKSRLLEQNRRRAGLEQRKPQPGPSIENDDSNRNIRRQRCRQPPAALRPVTRPGGIVNRVSFWLHCMPAAVPSRYIVAATRLGRCASQTPHKPKRCQCKDNSHRRCGALLNARLCHGPTIRRRVLARRKRNFTARSLRMRLA